MRLVTVTPCDRRARRHHPFAPTRAGPIRTTLSPRGTAMSLPSVAGRPTNLRRRAAVAGTATFGFFLLKGLVWLAALAMVGTGVGR